MSTDYMPLRKILACELFDGRLEEFGVRDVKDNTNEKIKCLTDGNNHLCVYITDAGFVDCLTRYASGGAPGKILAAIAEAFDADIVSEHEPQFWGFDTQEEWDAALGVTAGEHERFYIDLTKYLTGKPHDIRPGIGMAQAKIAKRLVKKDPSLLLPENKDRFCKQIRLIYDRDPFVK